MILNLRRRLILHRKYNPYRNEMTRTEKLVGNKEYLAAFPQQQDYIISLLDSQSHVRELFYSMLLLQVTAFIIIIKTVL